MFLKYFSPTQHQQYTNTEAAGYSDSVMKISRRQFVAGSGALIVGIALGSNTARAANDQKSVLPVKGGDADPSLWIEIKDDGQVLITCHRSEMGQQTWTSMAQIVADELEADWNNVAVVQAKGDAKYGDQNTDGSASVRLNFHRLRMAGAAMRTMLERAAALAWDADPSLCSASLGYVYLAETDTKLAYAELSKVAAQLPLPSENDIKLKGREAWRYIAKPIHSLTVPSIVKGEGKYGIDVDIPDMVHAVIARPPQVFSKAKTVDDTKALKVPNVIKTIQLPVLEAPAMFKPLGGVAVIANDTWSAIQGRYALEVEWHNGPNAQYNSESFRQEMIATARKSGEVKRERGDALNILANSKNKIVAEYYVPHFSQSPMEPPVATAHWQNGNLEVWAPVQDPQTTRKTLAGYFSIDVERVTVNVTLLGGAFGRKSKPDFVIEAAFLAKQINKPVKVTWTREDEIKHGFYHSCSAQRFEGALDKNGKCEAFLHRTVFPTIFSTFDHNNQQAHDVELGMGGSDNLFDVPNLRLEAGSAIAHARIGWMRAVANVYHVFGVQSFAAELAHKAGKDQKDYLLELIGPPRIVDPTKEGAPNHWNYNATLNEYPIQTDRLTNVTQKAAEMANWGRTLPKGHGLGIAAHRSFLSYIATVMEVAVDDDGSIDIVGVWLAVDAGTVVNPKHVKAQMQGGTLYGLSQALYGEISMDKGQVNQSNFPDYRVMRMDEAPKLFEVEIIESNEAPAGIGEPATPLAAPALANAIFNASGHRIRRLPMIGPTNNTLQFSDLTKES